MNNLGSKDITQTTGTIRLYIENDGGELFLGCSVNKRWCVILTCVDGVGVQICNKVYVWDTRYINVIIPAKKRK